MLRRPLRLRFANGEYRGFAQGRLPGVYSSQRSESTSAGVGRFAWWQCGSSVSRLMPQPHCRREIQAQDSVRWKKQGEMAAILRRCEPRPGVIKGLAGPGPARLTCHWHGERPATLSRSVGAQCLLDLDRSPPPPVSSSESSSGRRSHAAAAGRVGPGDVGHWGQYGGTGRTAADVPLVCVADDGASMP